MSPASLNTLSPGFDCGLRRSIHPEIIRRAIVGDHETGIPIGTEISRENAQPRPRPRVQTDLIGHILEPPVPQVAIQLGRRPLERRRTAIIEFAIEHVAGTAIEVDVVNHRQVQQAVPVVIDECGAGGPAGGSDAGAGGYVRERAVSVVVIQNVVAVIGDVEIDVPVVVVVAGRHAHAFIGVAYAGRFRDIGERQFARFFEIIPEQAVARLPTRRNGHQRLALRSGGISLDQINVQVAVVIIVDQRRARSHHFGQKHFAGGAGELPEVDPGLFRDVLEGE